MTMMKRRRKMRSKRKRRKRKKSLSKKHLKRKEGNGQKKAAPEAKKQKVEGTEPTTSFNLFVGNLYFNKSALENRYQ